MYGSPLPGRIQAQAEAWLGTPNFRVTSTFAEHVASGRGPGIDFGNGRCGDPVLACAAGVVQTIQDPNGALIVRIRHSATEYTGYAHLAVFTVTNGQSVARGQQIGTVGATGATACHLHWGVNRNGVEIDGWPLLDQNILGGDVKITITEWPAPRTAEIAAGATVDGWNATSKVTSQTFPGGSSFLVDATVDINQPTPPAGLFYRGKNGIYAGLYVPSPQVSLGPAPPIGGGFTQKDIDDAVSAAVTPIQIQLEVAKRKITEARTALGG